MREGATVHLTESGRTARVVRVLGEGGQGTVYEAVTDGGERLALKWYFERSATLAQRATIADLIERGAPDARFLWPLELATESGRDGFGYVMTLRPPQFVGLSALLEGAVGASLRVVCTVGYQLADSYLMLHAQGLCYRDISFGNVFFDPATGDVLICDNDNVGIDGATTSSVIGTKRFTAPEIVRREARPSSATDLYSLAVLLFYLLVVGHPLMGRRELDHPMWDESAELELFGRDPLFVFDDKDDSNRPVSGVHDAMIANWPIYPTRLRQMFHKAFTAGLGDPHGRVRESQWRAELVRCRDLLRICTRCGALNFFDTDGGRATCWNCSHPLTPPMCLVFDSCVLALSDGTEVAAHHIGRRQYDFTDVVARVTRHPEHPDRWGLTNASERPWRAVLPDGSTVEVAAGRTIGLVEGMQLDVDGTHARLHVP